MGNGILAGLWGEKLKRFVRPKGTYKNLINRHLYIKKAQRTNLLGPMPRLQLQMPYGRKKKRFYICAPL